MKLTTNPIKIILSLLEEEEIKIQEEKEEQEEVVLEVEDPKILFKEQVLHLKNTMIINKKKNRQ